MLRTRYANFMPTALFLLLSSAVYAQHTESDDVANSGFPPLHDSASPSWDNVPPRDNISPHPLASQDKEDSEEQLQLRKTKQILALTLPMVCVVILVVLIGCGIFYMLKQAKYGRFCCINANLSYHLQVDESPKDDRNGSLPRSGTPPPDYTPNSIGPPVYEDALQDIILSSRRDSEAESINPAQIPITTEQC